MIDINFIREFPEKVKENCKNRNVKCDVDKLLKLDKERTLLIQKVDEARSKLNIKGKPTEAELVKLQKTKAEEEKLSKELDKVETDYKELLFQIPNHTAPDVPIGKDDSENVEISSWGNQKDLILSPKTMFNLVRILTLSILNLVQK
jgi:seryl-tRNA synthetase